MIVVHSEMIRKKDQHTTTETRYYLSSLEPHERTPAQWQTTIRGHWGGVEIRNHWKRDALWREDGSRTRNAPALANLALLRSALLALLPEHYPEAASLPPIFEHLQRSPATALRLLRSP